MPSKIPVARRHKAFTLSLDMEDVHSPVVLVVQDGEATIYLTLKDAKTLSKELAKILKRFEARG